MNLLIFTKKHALLSLVMLIAQCLPAIAQGQITQSYQGKAMIGFSGTSTLHDFGGRIPDLPIRVERMDDPRSGNPMRWKMEASLEVAGMTTDHAKRDARMMEMFRVTDFPRIHLRTLDADPSVGLQIMPEPGPEQVLLGIRILDQEVIVPVRIVSISEQAGHLEMVMEAELSLKAFGLMRPQTALGLIKVGDSVKVRAQVVLDAMSEVKADQSPIK